MVSPVVRRAGPVRTTASVISRIKTTTGDILVRTRRGSLQDVQISALTVRQAQLARGKRVEELTDFYQT